MPDYQIDPSRYSGCGPCVKTCPEQAIPLEAEQAQLAADRCRGGKNRATARQVGNGCSTRQHRARIQRWHPATLDMLSLIGRQHPGGPG